MAAAKGNQYGAKAKVWTDAIQRALAKRSRLDAKETLDELAMKLIDLGLAGDLDSLKELGNRLEGKVAQSFLVGSDPENPLAITISSAENLRAKIRGEQPAPVGHRTEDSHPQYIDAGLVPAAQQDQQVDPE